MGVTSKSSNHQMIHFMETPTLNPYESSDVTPKHVRNIRCAAGRPGFPVLGVLHAGGHHVAQFQGVSGDQDVLQAGRQRPVGENLLRLGIIG